MFAKTEEEIEIMRQGGRELARIMKELEKMAEPEINTQKINELAEKLIFDFGGEPSFKGYGDGEHNRYPAAICASLNDEVVHGIPANGRILKNGDLLKIDIGMKYKGMHTDMARIFSIGEISETARKLKEITEKCFWEGVKQIKTGARMSAYSKAVQKTAEGAGFSVVKNLVGHGVGWELHEDPLIPNFWNKKCQEFFWEENMTIALEPMINEGGFETSLGLDGWLFSTRDGKLSAHYENTVVVGKRGGEVLTI